MNVHEHLLGTPALEDRPKIVVPVVDAWRGGTLVDAVRAAGELEYAAALALIARGGVWLDRYRVQNPDHPIGAAQQLGLHFRPAGARRAEVVAADILYEDAVLLALNKPPGVYVTMTPWDAARDMLWATTQFLTGRDGAPPLLHLAHRLDRDTSGVLLFSKSPSINSALQELFQRHAVHKRYHALVMGQPETDDFESRTGHGRGAYGLFRVYPLDMVGARLPYNNEVVKLMETRFTVVQRFDHVSLVEAQPITGRTHQIRLHLAALGHPVAGDARYGGPSELSGVSLSHHLLHAAGLSLPHPISRQPLHISAPAPPLFSHVLERLRQNE